MTEVVDPSPSPFTCSADGTDARLVYEVFEPRLYEQDISYVVRGYDQITAASDAGNVVRIEKRGYDANFVLTYKRSIGLSYYDSGRIREKQRKYIDVETGDEQNELVEYPDASTDEICAYFDILWTPEAEFEIVNDGSDDTVSERHLYCRQFHVDNTLDTLASIDVTIEKALGHVTKVEAIQYSLSITATELFSYDVTGNLERWESLITPGPGVYVFASTDTENHATYYDPKPSFEYAFLYQLPSLGPVDYRLDREESVYTCKIPPLLP